MPSNTGRVPRRPRSLWSLFPLVLVLASIPLWLPLTLAGDYPTHDGLFHLFRLVELDRAIAAGDLYPRLAANFALGYDYPVFNYYAPLSTYLTELLKVGGLGYLDAFKAVQGLVIVGCGLSMWVLGRALLPPIGAAFAALAYLYLPYLLTDIYVRGALAETIALAWLPLALWAAYKLGGEPSQRRITILALTLSALVLTHNITTVLGSVLVLGAWLLGLAARARHRQYEVSTASRERSPVLLLAAALALAAVFTSFYWLPALLEWQYVRSERLTEMFFNYHEHFQRVSQLVQRTLGYDFTYNFEQHILFRMGLVQALVAALGVAAAWTMRRHRALASICGWFILAALALQTPQTAIIWENVPLLGFAQFPWRLLAPIGVASSLLAGVLASSVWMAAKHRRLTAVPAAVGLAVTLALVIYAPLAQFHPVIVPFAESEVRPWTVQRMDQDRRLFATTVGEYIPRWTSISPFDFLQAAPSGQPPAGTLRLDVIAAGPFDYTLRGSADADTRLTLDRFYFPGWRAWIDGTPVETGPSGQLGLLSIAFPSGEHNVRIEFGSTPVRNAGAIAAVVAGVVLLGLLAWPQDRRLLTRRAAVAAATAIAVVMAVTLMPGTSASEAGSVISSSSGAEFGNIVRLAGTAVGRTDADGRLPVTLYWLALNRPGADLGVSLRLLDGDRVVGHRDKSPLFGLRPTLLWEKGQLTRDHQEIALDPGIPTGRYELALSVIDNTDGHPLQFSGPRRNWTEKGTRVEGVSLGTVDAAGTPLPNLAALQLNLSESFAGIVQLEGLDIGRLDANSIPMTPNPDDHAAVTVAPGQYVSVRPRWRSLTDTNQDYAVFTHLVDSAGKLAAQDDEWPHRGYFPTSLWLPGRVVEDSYSIRIPPDLMNGIYSVWMGMYRRADFQRLPIITGRPGRDQLNVAKVRVAPNPPPTLDQLQPRRRLDARLNGNILFLGYDLHAGPTPAGARLAVTSGSRLTTRLLWQADKPLKADYTVFVQVIGPDGKLVAQNDSQPAANGYPTSAWQAGEVVVDDHDLALPPGLAPGAYKLVTGMYELSTGARLPVASGGDSVTIEEFDIK